MSEGKATPSSGVTDRGKSNRFSHHAGVSGKKVRYSKVQDAKELGSTFVKNARANHHPGNDIKVREVLTEINGR